MAQFCIEIAGFTAQVRSCFDSTRDYCRKYLTDKPADFSVSVTEDMLDFEQQALDLEAEQEGLRKRVFTRPFLERAAIQRQVAEQLLDQGVLLFHGSALAADGRGYLFTAPCGTGKSTHARLWLRELGDRAQIINDDKPFLRLTDGQFLVCGAPWSGKHGLDNNICVPLQAICMLERGKENRIAPAASSQVRDFLAHQCLVPRQTERQKAFEMLVQTLADTVPVYSMQCTPQPEAARMAFEAMAPLQFAKNMV